MDQNIQELFKEESVKEMMEIFYATIRNILKLSEYEEELTLNFENIKFSSPKIRTFTFQQFIIGKQFTKFVEQLMELSTKTFYITPSINKKIGFCKIFSYFWHRIHCKFNVSIINQFLRFRWFFRSFPSIWP